MPNKLKLSGKKFARLLVIEDSGKRSSGGKVLWKCLCDCGNFVFVQGTNLNNGNTRSCGCLHREESAARLFIHGKSGTKEYERDLTLRKKYNITIQDLRNMYEKQNHRCAICKIPEIECKQFLHVDHDHNTGKIRGLLCYGCNSGLGGFKDSPNFLMSAVTYLLINF